MKRFLLFLLLGIFLASCAEQKSTQNESVYVATYAGFEQVIHLYRNADNGNRIERFQISISDGTEINGSIEWNGNEPVRIFGTTAYSGMSQEFDYQDKAFILEVIAAFENKQYIPIPVDGGAKLVPNVYEEYKVIENGVLIQNVSEINDPNNGYLPTSFTIVTHVPDFINVKGYITYDNDRRVKEIALIYSGAINEEIVMADYNAMKNIIDALISHKHVPVPHLD